MLLEFRLWGLLHPQTPQSAAGRLSHPKDFLPLFGVVTRCFPWYCHMLDIFVVHGLEFGFQCYRGTEVLLPPWDQRNTDKHVAFSVTVALRCCYHLEITETQTNTWLSVLPWHWGVVTTLRSTKHRQTRGFQCYSGTEVLLPPWDHRNTDKHVAFSVTVALRCCYHLEINETQTNTWLSVLQWHWGVVTTLRS